MREKVVGCFEKIIINVAKKSVGKSIPFSMYKVKKPDNFEKIMMRVEEEKSKSDEKLFIKKDSVQSN